MRPVLSLIRISAGVIIFLLGIIAWLVPVVAGWPLLLIAIPLIHPASGKKMHGKIKEWKDRFFGSAKNNKAP